jgi:hypothetical protein
MVVSAGSTGRTGDAQVSRIMQEALRVDPELGFESDSDGESETETGSVSTHSSKWRDSISSSNGFPEAARPVSLHLPKAATEADDTREPGALVSKEHPLRLSVPPTTLFPPLGRPLVPREIAWWPSCTPLWGSGVASSRWHLVLRIERTHAPKGLPGAVVTARLVTPLDWVADSSGPKVDKYRREREAIRESLAESSRSRRDLPDGGPIILSAWIPGSRSIKAWSGTRVPRSRSFSLKAASDRSLGAWTDATDFPVEPPPEAWILDGRWADRGQVMVCVARLADSLGIVPSGRSRSAAAFKRTVEESNAQLAEALKRLDHAEEIPDLSNLGLETLPGGRLLAVLRRLGTAVTTPSTSSPLPSPTDSKTVPATVGRTWVLTGGYRTGSQAYDVPPDVRAREALIYYGRETSLPHHISALPPFASLLNERKMSSLDTAVASFVWPRAGFRFTKFEEEDDASSSSSSAAAAGRKDDDVPRKASLTEEIGEIVEEMDPRGRSNHTLKSFHPAVFESVSPTRPRSMRVSFGSGSDDGRPSPSERPSSTTGSDSRTRKSGGDAVCGGESLARQCVHPLACFADTTWVPPFHRRLLGTPPVPASVATLVSDPSTIDTDVDSMTQIGDPRIASPMSGDIRRGGEEGSELLRHVEAVCSRVFWSSVGDDHIPVRTVFPPLATDVGPIKTDAKGRIVAISQLSTLPVPLTATSPVAGPERAGHCRWDYAGYITNDSVKNVQFASNPLVSDGVIQANSGKPFNEGVPTTIGDSVCFQCGRRGKNEFHLAARAPWSALQAFGYALTVLAE